MRGKRGGVERVERSHIVGKLIQLGLDLEFEAAILIERVRQSIERENQTPGALPENRNRASLRREFVLG